MAPELLDSVAQWWDQGPVSFSSFHSTKPLHGHKTATTVPGITTSPDGTQQKRRRCFLYFSYFPQIPPPSALSLLSHGPELIHVAISIPVPSKGNRITVVGMPGESPWLSSRVENSEQNAVLWIRKSVTSREASTPIQKRSHIVPEIRMPNTEHST